MRAAGVGVHGHGLDAQFDGEDAAHAERVDGPPVRVDIALFPNGPVAGEQFLVLLYELGNVGAADLFFAFHDEGDAAGQPVVIGRAHRIHGGETGDQFALVVDGPACIERAFAHGGLERRRGPQLQWLRRLHVVVVVEEQRARRLAGGVGDDDGVAVRSELVDGELAALQHGLDEVCAFGHAFARGRYARLGAQLGRFEDVFVEMLCQVEIDHAIGDVHGLHSP